VFEAFAEALAESRQGEESVTTSLIPKVSSRLDVVVLFHDLHVLSMVCHVLGRPCA
jgi:formaldehyde-activating enzyme involved in methanogenesis